MPRKKQPPPPLPPLDPRVLTVLSHIASQVTVLLSALIGRVGNQHIMDCFDLHAADWIELCKENLADNDPEWRQRYRCQAAQLLGKLGDNLSPTDYRILGAVEELLRLHARMDDM